LEDYKYEVAISCLKEDANIAQELYDLLRPRVRSIFFYPNNQDDLIARDGLEVFQNVFRRESRVVVVIYREGWGKTKWTAVEETAIKEMCFDADWTRIVVYSEDEKAPKWLPQSYIWAGKRYGLTALAGVIEQKVQEAGGNVGEEVVEEMAERIRRFLHAAEAREARRNSDEGIQASLRERKAIDERLAEMVARFEPTYNGLKIGEAGEIEGRMVRGTYRVTAGRLLGDKAVFFKSSGGAPGVMGEKLIICSGSLADWDQLINLQELESYDLELAEDDTTWRWTDSKGHYYTSAELADEALRWLLREYEKRRKADIARRRR
jgi:hypothetical protein